MYRNICLIGLPFSGKSLLGKRLSIKQKVVRIHRNLCFLVSGKIRVFAFHALGLENRTK